VPLSAGRWGDRGARHKALDLTQVNLRGRSNIPFPGRRGGGKQRIATVCLRGRGGEAEVRSIFLNQPLFTR